MKKLMLFVMVLAIALTLVGCSKTESELAKVRLAIHRNAGGANLLGVAIKEGYFEEEGIDIDYIIVENGVAEMASMRQSERTLDIGYIGAGVSWNAMDPQGNGLHFVFFDFLGAAENLVSRTGKFEDTNGNGSYDYAEIYEGLKGEQVYMQTSTTPGIWFKNLLLKLNEGKPADEQLWIHSETANYLTSYTAPNNDPALRIEVIDIENDKIPAAMSTVSDSRIDISVNYEPISSTILASLDDVEKIASTATHLPDSLAVGSWVASDKWLEEEPETVQKVVNALYKGALKRAEDPVEACRQGEIICQVPEGTFNPNVAIWPDAEMYQEWFENTTSRGYNDFRRLYDDNKGNVPSGNPKSFEDTLEMSFMLEAIKNIK